MDKLTVKLKIANKALQEAKIAWHDYAVSVSDEADKERAFAIFENLKLASYGFLSK